MPLRVVVRHLDGRRVLEQRSEPLVSLAALEPVPIVETFARGPAIVRTADAELVVGRVVPLAERGGGVVIAFQNLCDRSGLAWPLRVIAREPRRHLGDAPGVHRVMVAAGEQCGAGRRA